MLPAGCDVAGLRDERAVIDPTKLDSLDGAMLKPASGVSNLCLPKPKHRVPKLHPIFIARVTSQLLAREVSGVDSVQLLDRPVTAAIEILDQLRDGDLFLDHSMEWAEQRLHRVGQSVRDPTMTVFFAYSRNNRQ